MRISLAGSDDNLDDELLENVTALRRYAMFLCGDMSRSDDLVQETLVRVLAHARAWRPIKDLRAYLFTTLHNVFIDSNRRYHARVSDQPVETLLVDHVSPASQAQRIEVRELVEALQKIPTEQRETVLLVGLEGMSYAEAAKILGVPIGTVMSRLSRGREALRRLTDRTSISQLRVVK